MSREYISVYIPRSIVYEISRGGFLLHGISVNSQINVSCTGDTLGDFEFKHQIYVGLLFPCMLSLHNFGFNALIGCDCMVWEKSTFFSLFE